MSATTAQIRAAFAMTLSAFYPDWQVFPYFKSNPTPPSIDVMPGPILYDTAMGRGNDDVTYIVRAVVALGLDIAAQENLDQLLDLDPTSTTSMKNALETGRPNRSTLGNVVTDLRVVAASEYKMYSASGGTDIVGVEFTVDVIP